MRVCETVFVDVLSIYFKDVCSGRGSLHLPAAFSGPADAKEEAGFLD